MSGWQIRVIRRDFFFSLQDDSTVLLHLSGGPRLCTVIFPAPTLRDEQTAPYWVWAHSGRHPTIENFNRWICKGQWLAKSKQIAKKEGKYRWQHWLRLIGIRTFWTPNSKFCHKLTSRCETAQWLLPTPFCTWQTAFPPANNTHNCYNRSKPQMPLEIRNFAEKSSLYSTVRLVALLSLISQLFSKHLWARLMDTEAANSSAPTTRSTPRENTFQTNRHWHYLQDGLEAWAARRVCGARAARRTRPLSPDVQLGELSTITMKCCTLSIAIKMIMILLKNIIASHSFNSGNLNSQRKQEAL